MHAIQFLTYAGLIIAFAAMLVKAMRYYTAPQHFRWELYPVPHEKGRAEYGGSYLEELDWWSKPRHSDRLNELKEMMAEIILLKGVRRNNKKVWTFSFPFHFGLYLCIGWLMLLLLGAVLQIADIRVTADTSGLGILIHYCTLICGYGGLILAGLGALGLFFWRMTDGNQKAYNAPADFINLVLFVIVVGVTLYSQFTLDPGFIYLRAYTQSLITFDSITFPGTLFTVEVALISLLIMYIPLTKMSHFVAKYFLYHTVRWNDEPNFRGSDIEKNIMALLQQKVGWSAPHIQTGQPWTEVVKEMHDEKE
jgi:nitrate reductase gamma subunit